MTHRSCAARALAETSVHSEEEAIIIARSVASRHGWPWEDPARATFVRLIDGRPEWRVQGGRVYVIIDDRSGYPFIKTLSPVPKWRRKR
jgi:hypothetical protein